MNFVPSLSPDSLREKPGHPGSPNKLDLATVPNIKIKKKNFFVIAKIRERWYIQCGHVEKMNIKGTMTPP